MLIAQDYYKPRIKSMGLGHALCQNRMFLPYWRFQLYLATYLLVFNAQYQILSQNTKPYCQILILANL